jgi:hypothetical protein
MKRKKENHRSLFALLPLSFGEHPFPGTWVARNRAPQSSPSNRKRMSVQAPCFPFVRDLNAACDDRP